MDNNTTATRTAENTVLPGLIFAAVLAGLALLIAPEFVIGMATYLYSHLFEANAAILGSFAGSVAWLGSLVGLG
jgi:membrane protein YqaA with SNARE-associated domain